MSLSVDTNILVYALNTRSDVHHAARRFLESISERDDVVIAENVLIELYLLIRNPTVFPAPYAADEATAVCRRFRSNPHWRVIECRPVMDRVWGAVAAAKFPRRRIIDLRLGFTLLAAGVSEFATRNADDFADIGFTRVFDPLA